MSCERADLDGFGAEISTLNYNTCMVVFAEDPEARVYT
jgi:hypothetical protein